MDPEKARKLANLFRAEVKDHLAALSDNLLALEKQPEAATSKSAVEEIFRSFHTLKGCSRALGAKGIEVICHRLEDQFSQIRSGKRAIDPGLVDLSLKGLDAVRGLQETEIEVPETDPRVQEFLGLVSVALGGSPRPPSSPPRATTTTPAQAPVPTVSMSAPVVEETLSSKPPDPKTIRNPPPSDATKQVADESSPPEKASIPPPPCRGESARPAVASDARGISIPKAQETIRVAADKLDSLMNRVGELVISKIKTDQRLQDIQAVVSSVGRCSNSFVTLQAQVAHTIGERLTSLREWQAMTKALRSLEQRVTILERDFGSDIARMSLVSRDLEEDVRNLRLLPFSELVGSFHRMVRDLARELGKKVALQVEGGDTEVDKGILEGLRAPILHLLRNALDHGIEPVEERAQKGKPREGCIILRASHRGMRFVVEVSDDGRGIDIERTRLRAGELGLYSRERLAQMESADLIELLFRPGFTTASRVTEISGRGVGMDVVAERMTRLNGTVDLQTTLGRGTTVCLSMPLTLITTQALLIRSGSQMLALPTASVERTLELGKDDIRTVDNRQVLLLNGQPVLLVSLERVLDSTKSRKLTSDSIRALILSDGARRVALVTDEIVGEQEVVHKSLGKQYARVRNVSGATILGTGRVVIILNPHDLIRNALGLKHADSDTVTSGHETRRVLVVEDSYGTRTYEKEILESAGFEVFTAVDGLAALDVLAHQPVDLVVADIEMPRLDGISLTRRIRENLSYAKLPVVLVTAMESSEYRKAGLDAGADVYVLKQDFDQEIFLHMLRNLTARS